MSKFVVQLNNSGQGLLDRVYSASNTGGTQQTVSVQRTVYVMGPGKINRKLTDGETFTDCNYWKRFAYPQVALADAIVTVLEDDGSIYSDSAQENTFLRSYTLSVADGSTYTTTANIVDILGTYSGYAIFTQITNNGSGSVSVKINGNTNSVFTLAAGDTQIFNAGDLAVGSISFANSSGSTQSVAVLVSVRVDCQS